MNFDDKVVVITGASSGIGREAAIAFVEQGCKNIDCIDINADNGISLTEKLNSYKYVNAQFYAADISQKCQVVSVINKILKQRKRVDILVHSAGINLKRDLLDLTDKEWDKTLKVNLYGTFYTTIAVSKAMIEQNYGKIVIVSSGSAVTGTGGGIHYAASKAGQIGLMRALANKLAAYNINVNAIGPRNIQSPMLDNLYTFEEKKELAKKIPLQRLGTPREVANLVLFLASDLSCYITGQFLIIDGGRTFSF